MENASEATKKWGKGIKEHPLPFAWLLSAFISVILPLVIFLIARRRNEYYYGWDDHHYDEQSLGALIFVYVWSLVSFFVVVYFGNQYFRNAQEGDSRSFIVMLAMFANLSFVAMILSLSNMRALDGHAWDGRCFSLFPSLMIFTYAFWTFLGLVFVGILFFNKYNKMKQERKVVADNANSYHRQTDEEASTASSNAPPSSRVAVAILPNGQRKALSSSSSGNLA